MIACPEGTFKNFTGGSSLSSCKSCPPGSYCQGLRNENPTGQCDGGYYCRGGSWSKTPIGDEIYNGTWTCPLYNIGR